MTDVLRPPQVFRKAPTGIAGLDEITHGGLPAGRPTLVCGGPGSGKTLLGISFLVHGIVQYDEPGVLMSFEENAEELAEDVASLGFDLAGLVAQKRLVIDYVHVDRAEIEETGEYDLEGLFVRLDHAVSSVKAKRVVLDTIESLFAGLENETVLRAELRRLFRWLRDRDFTVVITGERGERTLTRHGLEEYVSDAVIQLDHRVDDQISTRRIRVVKYRGSHHGTNEYPFLIDADGLSVLPVTSLQLQHDASLERVSSGQPQLDQMLSGQGYYRGSTVLVSGTAGTGKTSLAAQFADAACRRGERCLYFLFEESPQQMVRNMRVGRRGPAAVGRQRPAPVPRGSALALRPGDPPGHDASRRRTLPPRRGGRRPDDQPADGGHAHRRPRDAHAHHRLPEDPRHHGDVHRADVERRGDGHDRDDDLVVDGHVGSADQLNRSSAAVVGGSPC